MVGSLRVRNFARFALEGIKAIASETFVDILLAVGRMLVQNLAQLRFDDKEEAVAADTTLVDSSRLVGSFVVQNPLWDMETVVQAGLAQQVLDVTGL